MKATLEDPKPVEQLVHLVMTRQEAQDLKLLVGRYKYDDMRNSHTGKLYDRVHAINSKVYTALTGLLGFGDN